MNIQPPRRETGQEKISRCIRRGCPADIWFTARSIAAGGWHWQCRLRASPAEAFNAPVAESLNPVEIAYQAVKVGNLVLEQFPPVIGIPLRV
jgi:hypothetical protein